jgi:hypothetical protein
MDDYTLTKWLRAVADKDRLESSVASMEEQNPDCLSLPRLRTAEIREDWQAAEVAHLATCARCRATREKLRAALWHPDLWHIALYLAGRLTGDEAVDVPYHLDEDGCRRCRRRATSPTLRRIVDQVHRGLLALDQAQAALREWAAFPVTIPAEVGAFAPTTRRRYHFHFRHPEGLWAATLREDADGILWVHVEAANPDWAGRSVRVEILGEGETLTQDVPLEVQPDQEWAGRAQFGSFAELAPRLGANPEVMIPILDPVDEEC